MRKDVYYHSKFTESYSSLQDLLYYISTYAWFRLESHSKHSAPVGEVDITNTLVAEILTALCQEKANLPIRFFHAKDENRNGNDLEIIVPIDNYTSIIMPCQAKKLYVDKIANNLIAKYNVISHPVKKDTINEKEQICCLLDYAKEIGGFPLYLFYNYTESLVEINQQYPEKELYGCTLTNAQYLFEKYYDANATNNKMRSFTFQDIHPPSKPLVSLLNTQSLPLKTFFGESQSTAKLKFYKNTDLLEQKFWVERCPPFSKDVERGSPESKSLEAILGAKTLIPEEYPFKPKYRIMLLNKPIVHRDKNVTL